MKRMAILLIFLLTLNTSAFSEEMLMIIAPERVTGYLQNDITVECGRDGLLTLELRNADGVVYILTEAQSVVKGTNAVAWDGLGAWNRPLERGEYTLHASLTHDDGRAEAEKNVTVAGNAQALVFALGSAETICQKGAPLEITYRLVRAGRIAVEVYAAASAEEPLGIYKKSVENNRPAVFSWDGQIDGVPVPEGEYILRLYAEENEQRSLDIPVCVVENQDEQLLITGAIMPGENQNVWDAICAPAVVADVGAQRMLHVYYEPDSQSEALGSISGQTQCVEVVRTGAVWTQIRCWRQEDGAPITGFVQTDRLKLAAVNTEYGLVIDKAAQTMTVYRRGEIIGSMQISTGRAAYRKLERETPAGSYVIGERLNVLSDNGIAYDHAIRFSGNRALYAAAGTYSGKSTAGGIAVANAEDESQLDAYWLWTHIPPNTRLVILDDPAERTLENACAQAQVDMTANLWRETDQAEAPAEGETVITLTLGGDAVLGTREQWMNSDIGFPACIEREGAAYPFSGLQEYFAADDMTLVNLECVLKGDATGEDKEKLYRFRGLPSYTDVLKAGSIEQVNIANNHHIDYGRAGKAETVAALEAAGIPYSGYGAVYIWEMDGWKIGFGGCRETTWRQGGQDVTAEISALRDAGCDVVLYSCHWGEEYNPRHNETQLSMMQEIVAAGADVIIGHHPHVVQGVDEVDGTLVLFSLGNLMFGGTHDMETFDGALARLELRFDENGYQGAALTMIPILTSNTSGANDFHPTPAEGEDALRILGKIQADSGVLIRQNMFFPAR